MFNYFYICYLTVCINSVLTLLLLNFKIIWLTESWIILRRPFYETLKAYHIIHLMNFTRKPLYRLLIQKFSSSLYWNKIFLFPHLSTPYCSGSPLKLLGGWNMPNYVFMGAKSSFLLYFYKYQYFLVFYWTFCDQSFSEDVLLLPFGSFSPLLGLHIVLSVVPFPERAGAALVQLQTICLIVTSISFEMLL